MKVTLIVCILSMLFIGCTRDPVALDGKLVKGSDGTLYQIEANFGDTYFIRAFELKEMEAWIKELK